MSGGRVRYLTVEEVSVRYGVPVSTVRRWCADGTLPAEKSGRQWLVREDELPTSPPRVRTRRPTTAQSSSYDVSKALLHVTSTDLRETWVPDVLDFQDVPLDDSLLSRVSQRLNDNVVSPPTEVPIPKTPFFTRSAVLLTLEDRIAYQAVVGSFAERAEAQTYSGVYSARLATKPGKYFFRQKGTDAWLAFRKAVQREFEAGPEWLVKTDLTAYFDTISHDLLINEIVALNVPGRTIGLLRSMLRQWALVPGIGIPQGPNASRLLGNLYLHPIDQAMAEAGYKYFRYLDDVYIAAKTRRETTAAIRLFERECRLRGLLVSSSKTVPLHGKEAKEELAGETELDAAQYLMDADQLPKARKKLKQILKKSLHDDGRIDVRSARFSLWRLTLLRESSFLTPLLRRLEDLAPVATVAMTYLRPFLMRPQVVRGLTDFLHDEERISSPFMMVHVLALTLDHPGPLPLDWISAVRGFARDRNQPVYLRVVAANVLARGMQPGDLTWLRGEISREFDPALIRGYAVALTRAKAFDKGTEKAMVTRAPELAPTARYLRGRNTLPSLLFRDQTNPLGR
jgi:excisionase family DNA binding protein